jgi:hypothetical protein
MPAQNGAFRRVKREGVRSPGEKPLVRHESNTFVGLTELANLAVPDSLPLNDLTALSGVDDNNCPTALSGMDDSNRMATRPLNRTMSRDVWHGLSSYAVGTSSDIDLTSYPHSPLKKRKLEEVEGETMPLAEIPRRRRPSQHSGSAGLSSLESVIKAESMRVNMASLAERAGGGTSPEPVGRCLLPVKRLAELMNRLRRGYCTVHKHRWDDKTGKKWAQELQTDHKIFNDRSHPFIITVLVTLLSHCC